MVKKEDLLKTLEDLTDEEFKDFKCLLKDGSLEGYQTITACRLQKAERRVTVDLMVKTYQLPAAVEATKKLLKKINRNDLLQRLSDRSSGPEVNFRDDLGASENRGPSSPLPHLLPEVYEDDSTILDKFKVLHIDDVCGDVDEEVSEVTPHHVKSLEPTLSLRAVLMQLGFPVKIKCNALIYYKLNPSSLNLHVYLIPNDPGVQKRVDDKENKHGYKEIRKPHPDRYLGMEERFILTADNVKATITPPEGLKLSYTKGPHFYEVYIQNPDRDFNLKLCRTKRGKSKPVWTCGIDEDDYSNSGEGGTEMSNAAGSSGGEEIPMSHIRRPVNISDEEASENRGPSSSQTRPPPEVSTISSQSEVDVSDDDEASENRGPSSSQPRPLPEVSTISSQNEGTSRSSESGSITDSSDWTTLEPEVNSPDADEAPTYSLQSEAGRFECRVSSLRWVCKEKVSFKYQFGTLPEYMERTERLGYMPAGPILDIKVISGKLNEVYLPHWICTDDSTILDKFAVLHVDDACGDVVEEVSEVTPHHVKLLEPTFSPRMVLVRLGLPVTIKCNVLIYYKLKRSLNLHVYLIPHDPGLQKTVHQRENKDGYKEIRKPHPDRYLGMEQIFILTADMNTAKVTPPQGLTLRYHSSEPNFYEVVIKNPDRDVNLKLKREEPVSEPVWTCGIEEDDYSNSGEGGTEMQRRIHVETLTPADSYPPLTLSSGREEMQMRPEEHPAFDQSPFIQEEEDDTTIKENILKLLQRLSEEEFKDFKWYLQNEKSRPIPQSKLEKADRTHVVDLIEQTYGHQAVKVIKDIFKKMKRNDLVRRL